MATYQIISTGNRIEADEAFVEGYYPGDYVLIPTQAAPSYRTYTIAQFIEALTRPEALTFLATMKTDPLLEMWYELAKARGVIDFNDADTLTNAPYLVQAGVVTQSRLDELTG